MNEIEINENDRKWIESVWEKLDRKLSVTAVKSFDKIPYSAKDGVHDNRMELDPAWWTNGFWPALMILMYDATGREQYLKTAHNAMNMLDAAFSEYDALNHDMGFMWDISAGYDYRLTGNKKERNRFLFAASLLMSRFNNNGRFIRAWNGSEHKGWAIIDCMMNLPLLYRASEELDDDRFKMVAVAHADTTMKYHVRDDGSCNHINEYDCVTGEFLTNHTGQGFGGYKYSSWSRGQAWGLYGFVLSYIFTKNEAYLSTAKRIAHYFISNASLSQWLPLSDFRAPKEPVIYDSTAGACAACGLLEIAKNVDEHESDLYVRAALNILKAMEKRFCVWDDSTDYILGSGAEAYGFGYDKPIIYGDYFFAEAIYKLKSFNNLAW